MSTRAQALATRFEQANADVIRAVEPLSDAQWGAQTAEEGWTVGVVAHHIAQSHQGVAGLAEMVASGKPVPPITWDVIHQGNATHARDHGHCTKPETLALLRDNGAAAAKLVRGLSDQQLDRSASVIGNPMSAGQVVEHILIGHPQGHLASIKAALKLP